MTTQFNQGGKYGVKQIANLQVCSNAAAVTPSNTVDLSTPGIIYVDDTTSGTNVKVDTINGQTITITSVAEGSFVGGNHPIIVKRVYATGTTADTLFVFY